MKQLSFLSKSRVPTDAMEAEIELDTSPIMNVLIILIPFLASVAVYTHLAIINLSLPPNISANNSAGVGERPKFKTTVLIAEKYLAITIGERMVDSIPNIEKSYNYELLKNKLLNVRESAEFKNEVVVAVNDPILFKHVVSVMDACRESGFVKVGLTAGFSNLN